MSIYPAIGWPLHARIKRKKKTSARERAQEKLKISTSKKENQKQCTVAAAQNRKTKWEFYLFRFIFFYDRPFSVLVPLVVLCGAAVPDLCVAFAQRNIFLFLFFLFAFSWGNRCQAGEMFECYRYTGRSVAEQWIDLKHIEYDIFVKWSADADATTICEVI